MRQNSLQCSLHNLPFTLYCDHCLQPTCHKCTFIGPHNTPIHSLTPLHQSYQRRVQQLNTRLQNLSQIRQHSLQRITIITHQIERIKLQSQQIKIENNRNRSQIQQKLAIQYENIVGMLIKEEQNILGVLNQINDLGHEFENISVTSDIQCLINFQRILDQLRETVDQLEILLDKPIPMQELPKQLSQLRIKLTKINSYNQIFKYKQKILQQLIVQSTQQIKKIQTPKIPYQQMLEIINGLLQRYDENYQEPNSKIFENWTKKFVFGAITDLMKSQQQKQKDKEKQKEKLEQQAQRYKKIKKGIKKIHYVCFFCGVILDDDSINTLCTKNKIAQQMKTTDYYSNIGQIEVPKHGYTKQQPDISLFGTQRHYFSQPLNPNIFFRAAFLNLTLGKEVLTFLSALLPQSSSAPIMINTSTKNNTFLNYLQLLFLKIQTLSKIKNKSLQRLFKRQDIKPIKDEQIGYCQCVAMEYILVEIIGLEQKQAEIVMDMCQFMTSGVEQFGDIVKNKKVRNYRCFVEKIKEIKI